MLGPRLCGTCFAHDRRVRVHSPHPDPSCRQTGPRAQRERARVDGGTGTLLGRREVRTCRGSHCASRPPRPETQTIPRLNRPGPSRDRHSGATVTPSRRDQRHIGRRSNARGDTYGALPRNGRVRRPSTSTSGNTLVLASLVFPTFAADPTHPPCAGTPCERSRGRRRKVDAWLVTATSSSERRRARNAPVLPRATLRRSQTKATTRCPAPGAGSGDCGSARPKQRQRLRPSRAARRVSTAAA